MRLGQRAMAICLICLIMPMALSAQSSTGDAPAAERINYLRHYNYPLGIGLGYRYGLDSGTGEELTRVMLIDASVRRPLARLPMIQPPAQFGVMLNQVVDDPNAGGQILRSIRIGEPSVQPLFAAMHSYHAVNP